MDLDMELYDINDVAALFRKSTRTIKRWRDKGEFPQGNIIFGNGQSVLWTKEQLLGVIASKTAKEAV